MRPVHDIVDRWSTADPRRRISLQALEIAHQSPLRRGRHRFPPGFLTARSNSAKAPDPKNSPVLLLGLQSSPGAPQIDEELRQALCWREKVHAVLCHPLQPRHCPLDLDPGQPCENASISQLDQMAPRTHLETGRTPPFRVSQKRNTARVVVGVVGGRVKEITS